MDDRNAINSVLIHSLYEQYKKGRLLDKLSIENREKGFKCSVHIVKNRGLARNLR